MTDHTDAPLTTREAVTVWTIWAVGMLIVAGLAISTITGG